MDTNDTVQDLTLTLGKEIARAFTINLAATAGALAGFGAVGLAIGAVSALKDKRDAKKLAAETPAE